MAIDVAVEEVASNLEEIAEATRRINTNSVSFFLGGAIIGAGIGFYFGYRWNKEKIKAEIYEESEREVEKIRKHYQQKTVAAEPKPDLGEVIEEKGYSTETQDDVGESMTRPSARPLRAPVPGLFEPPPQAAPPVVTYDGGKDKDRDWNYPEELQNRSDDRPYIIHQDEFKLNESGYPQTVYTWYAVDSVMVEQGDPSPLDNVAFAVGEDNLRFGHGSDDIDVVFVRNPILELEMEICRHPGSYEEEVVGLDGNEPD